MISVSRFSNLELVSFIEFNEKQTVLKLVSYTNFNMKLLALISMLRLKLW